MRRLLPYALLPLLCAPLLAAADWKSDLGKIWQQTQQQSGASALGESEIVAGLREALAKGTTNAINQLGRSDGFWSNQLVRIPLPQPLASVDKSLRQFGQGPRLDQFQLTLNRAAEQAVPQVAGIFGDAVRQMSVTDARGILSGPKDAATKYFKAKAGASLKLKILPLVQNATAQVGVTQSYKNVMGQAAPFLQMAGKNTATDLDGFVTDKAVEGLFTTIAGEEAKIRDNPAARTSDLLRRVFGGTMP